MTVVRWLPNQLKREPAVHMNSLNLYAGIGGNRELWTGCDVVLLL